jgi:hypothetical protein
VFQDSENSKGGEDENVSIKSYSILKFSRLTSLLKVGGGGGGEVLGYISVCVRAHACSYACLCVL